jgi:hypothetical protein
MDAIDKFAAMLGEIKRPTPELLAAWLTHRTIKGAAPVYSIDGVSGANVTVTLNNLTTLVSSNPVKGPLENCKVIVFAWMALTVGAGTTSFQPFIQRNITAENVTIAGPAGINATPANNVLVTVVGVDRVPDGRDCVYTMQFASTGATGNHTANNPTIVCAVVAG